MVAHASPEAKTPDSRPRRINRTRVMIVDDDSDIRTALRIALSSRGYDVVDAGTGEEALEKLRPDINVVVLDVGLPGAGGLHTCRLIRAKSRARIIMMSAQSAHGEAEA